MSNTVKRMIQYISIFLISGFIYCGLELLVRQRTHITMFFLGGMCGLIISGLNNVYTYELDFSIQIILSMFIITLFEYIFGVIFNQDYTIWDYRDLPFNINGQVQIYFSLLWGGISIFAIPFLDYIEYTVFNYRIDTPPYYKLFGKVIFQFKDRCRRD